MSIVKDLLLLAALSLTMAYMGLFVLLGVLISPIVLGVGAGLKVGEERLRKLIDKVEPQR